MAKKLTAVVLASILLAGCAQFAEMEATREAGSAYLTGKFDEQICELEAIAEKSPELGYSTARIVQEVIPQRGSGVSWILKTKQTPPQAKIRYYGSKVEYPTKKEELDAWMKAIDDNVAKLKDKINAAAEEAKRKEEERVAEAKHQEAERANALLLKFCEEQGITPKDVLQTDVKVVERPFSNITKMEWTDAGLKRQQEIIVTNMFAELQVEMPSIVKGKEEELCPMLLAVNSNNVLNINFELCATLRDGDSKYHDKLYNSGKFHDLFDRDKFSAAKNFVDFITNLCFTIDGKSFGPVFSVNGSDRKVAFNKDTYGEFLENKFLSLANMEKGINRLGVFKSTLIDIKKNLPDTARFMLLEDLSFNYWNDRGRIKYKIGDIAKFANQYAAAKLLIENEEAMRKRLAEEYVTMPESEKFPLLSVQPKPQMLMKDIYSGVSIKWVQGWLLANKIEYNEPKIIRDSEWIITNAKLKTCKVAFYFVENALKGISIDLKQETTVEAIIDKYSQLLGSNAKVTKDIGSFDLGDAAEDFIAYTLPVTVRIQTDELEVQTKYNVASLHQLSSEAKIKVLDPFEDSFTKLTAVKDDVRKALKKKNNDWALDNSNKVYGITIIDVRLCNYSDEIEQQKKEADAKAAEEAKKAKAAAALDF